MKTKQIGWIVMMRIDKDHRFYDMPTSFSRIRWLSIRKMDFWQYRQKRKRGDARCVKVYIEDEE